MASRTLLTLTTVALCCATMPAIVPADTPAGHDLGVVALELPAAIESASTVRSRVEIHNRGLHGWSAEDGFALAYHWLSSDGDVVEWDGVRTPFAEPVGPGERVIVDAAVKAPSRAGDYLLQWDVVQEGVLWVSEVDPSPVDPVPVAVAATHAFSFDRATTPRVLVVDGARVARATVRNDGLRTWLPDGSVSLAYHWYSHEGELVRWEGRRVGVHRKVAPGEEIELQAVVEAPDAAGRYRLVWDMVEENVCWFSERDPSPEAPVVVVVLPSYVVDALPWSILVLAAAVAAVFVLRAGLETRWRGLWSVSDVIWCVAAIVVKQAWVLNSAGLGFSIAGWCFAAAGAALFGCLLLVLPDRIRPWTAWASVAAVTSVLFADLVHLRFFGDLGSMAGLRSLGQIGRVEASIRSMLQPGDLWFWADLPAAVVLVMAASKLGAGLGLRRRLGAGLGLIGVAGMVCGAFAVRPDRAELRQVFHTTQMARHTGVLNLHAMDLGGEVIGLVVRPEIREAEYQEIVEYFERRRPLRAGVGPSYAAANGRNLVMIQVESLQAFVVDFRIGGQEVTPFLNALAADNLWFANVTDQTEEGRSSDSELATQVSLLPPDRGAAAFLFPSNEFTGLASILGDHGYSSVSAVPFEGSFWNRRTTHRAYGFGRSLFVADFEAGETIGWGLNDRDFLSSAAHRLAKMERPWCAFLLTLSLHHPFEGFPEDRKVLDVGDWEGTPFGNYLHTMRFFDDALAAFVADLDRMGLLEETVIALWGDHDAGFEWRSEIADAIGVSPDPRGWYLSQQVPLVIRVPGFPGPDAPFDIPAGHADVAPTLLALLGVDPAPYAFLGRNLLGAPGPGPVIGEYRCWRDSTHLYLRRGPSLADGECVDLETMEAVSTEVCSAGFDEIRRQVEISTLVLERDLQHRLHHSMIGERP
jgi:phosphoglycerol transferase MdoB-like AlkP superfamily enzyme